MFAEFEPAFRGVLDGLRFTGPGTAASDALQVLRGERESPFRRRPAIASLVRFGLALLVILAGVFQVQRHHAAVAMRARGLPSPGFSGIALPVAAIVLGVILLLASPRAWRPG